MSKDRFNALLMTLARVSLVERCYMGEERRIGWQMNQKIYVDYMDKIT